MKIVQTAKSKMNKTPNVTILVTFQNFDNMKESFKNRYFGSFDSKTTEVEN